MSSHMESPSRPENIIQYTLNHLEVMMRCVQAMIKSQGKEFVHDLERNDSKCHQFDHGNIMHFTGMLLPSVGE